MSEPNMVLIGGPRREYTAAQQYAADENASQVLKGIEQLNSEQWQLTRSKTDAFERVTLTQYSTEHEGERIANAMVGTALREGWTDIRGYGTDRWKEQVNKASQQALEAIENAKVLNTVEQPGTPEQNLQELQQTANATAPTSPSEEDLKQEEQRRLALEAQLQQQWRVANDRYYHRDGNGDRLAFRDRGKSIATTLNSERVSAGIVQLAEAKGWTSIRVSGHEEFRRQVWREASERGISVKGYEPSTKEQKLAELREQQREPNVVTKDDGERQVDRESPSVASSSSVRKVIERESSSAASSSSERKVIEEEHDKSSGRLLSHGQAPYQHNPKKSASYYATIETNQGEYTVWGIGLSDAIKNADAQKGDHIRLERTDAKAVEVQDEDGVWKAAQRNTWTVTHLSERARVIGAISEQAIQERIADSASRDRVRSEIASRVTQAERRGDLPSVRTQDHPETRDRRRQELTR